MIRTLRGLLRRTDPAETAVDTTAETAYLLLEDAILALDEAPIRVTKRGGTWRWRISHPADGSILAAGSGTDAGDAGDRGRRMLAELTGRYGVLYLPAEISFDEAA